MERLKYLLDILKNGKQNICYGAGDYGQQLLGFLQTHGFDIDYFVVSENSNIEKLFGIPVVNIYDLKNSNNYNWIISVSEKYVQEIKTILKNKYINPCFIMNSNDINNIIKDALAVNKELYNIVPKNRRCFIMGTGETIKHQNLKLLQNEDVFSCSFCSLLEGYNDINPQYYILPALTSDMKKTELERETYIKEKIAFYSKSIISPLIFCDYNDRNYIRYYGGFEGKKIYYLCQSKKWNEQRKYIYNLCEKTPYIQTGSIMMLKVAMYMGYKEIYLIGTEHDLVTHKYEHAYDLERLKEYDANKLLQIALTSTKKIEQRSNREILSMSLNMYNQYFYLHNIARQEGIQIYNATDGGSLDEFKRIKFETLF